MIKEGKPENFEIKCKKCNSINVEIWGTSPEGVDIECKDCKFRECS